MTVPSATPVQSTTPRERTTAPASWEALLIDAVQTPGRLLDAYHAFHSYSFGNQLLAMFQCRARGLQPGPLATYPGWQAKGRQVRRGERALTLCRPITVSRRRDAEDDTDDVRTIFVYRPHWFVASQTDGAPLTYDTPPTWDRTTALATLNVRETRFTLLDGNTQGYAHPDRREIAINPVAAMPTKTTFHELAHVLLHGAEGKSDDHADLPHSLEEVEAEAVALILTESLGLPGAEFCRGYIQHWLAADRIPEANARRILSAADKILRAGTPGARKGE